MTEMTNFQREISRLLPNIKLLFNEPMAKHTSFRIGGPAEVMAFPENADQTHYQLEPMGNQHRIVADQQIVYHPATGISCFKNLVFFGCGLHQAKGIENNTGKGKQIPQGFKGEHRPYCVDPQKHPSHDLGLFLLSRQEKHNHRLNDCQDHHTGAGDAAGKNITEENNTIHSDLAHEQQLHIAHTKHNDGENRQNKV